MIYFADIAYLKNGNLTQRRAYKVLANYSVFDNLKVFDPFLAGTIPININIEGSDLDVLCYWKNKEDFTETILKHFAENRDFTIREMLIQNEPTIIASFFIEDFEIEIFGQNIPVQQQSGYRHMIIEYNLLLQFGEEFRKNIIDLKRQGFKTEPAFAELFGLSGDPYQALLDFEKIIVYKE